MIGTRSCGLSSSSTQEDGHVGVDCIAIDVTGINVHVFIHVSRNIDHQNTT